MGTLSYMINLVLILFDSYFVSSWGLTRLPTTFESILFSPPRTGLQSITLLRKQGFMSHTLFNVMIFIEQYVLSRLTFIKRYEPNAYSFEHLKMVGSHNFFHRLAGVRRLAPSTELVRNQNHQIWKDNLLLLALTLRILRSHRYPRIVQMCEVV